MDWKITLIIQPCGVLAHTLPCPHDIMWENQDDFQAFNITERWI